MLKKSKFKVAGGKVPGRKFLEVVLSTILSETASVSSFGDLLTSLVLILEVSGSDSKFTVLFETASVSSIATMYLAVSSSL